MVTDYAQIEKALNELERTKQGMVEVKIEPPMARICSVDCSYKKGNFYTYYLQEREDGKGYWFSVCESTFEAKGSLKKLFVKHKKIDYEYLNRRNTGEGRWIKMSGSAFMKMRDEFAIALILAAFLTFAFVFIPNYQKYAYQDTAPIEYSPFMRTDCVGYPAAESFPAVNSIAEIESGEEAKKVEKFRYLIMTVVFMGSWIMFSVRMVRLTNEEKKK